MALSGITFTMQHVFFKEGAPELSNMSARVCMRVWLGGSVCARGAAREETNISPGGQTLEEVYFLAENAPENMQRSVRLTR